MAPFAAAQCRGLTLLRVRVRRYPWLRWRVGTKGAPSPYFFLQGIRRTCGFTRLPPLVCPLTLWYLRGLATPTASFP